MWWIALLAALAVYALMSAVTFVFFAADKFRASFGAHRRTPEATLHLLSALGGFPGGFAAMAIIRHKTQKPSFYMVMFAIACVHALMWLAIAAAVVLL